MIFLADYWFVFVIMSIVIAAVSMMRFFKSVSNFDGSFPRATIVGFMVANLFLFTGVVGIVVALIRYYKS